MTRELNDCYDTLQICLLSRREGARCNASFRASHRADWFLDMMAIPSYMSPFFAGKRKDLKEFRNTHVHDMAAIASIQDISFITRREKSEDDLSLGGDDFLIDNKLSARVQRFHLSLR
jgi:hypothetical protein